MAERRMFAKTIIDSDAFLDMPLSAQSLYFHLSMRADDEGFINNPKKIQRMIGASEDDLKLLLVKNFLIAFETGVVVIKHWKIHNYIQSDRFKKSVYTEERAMLTEKENHAYTLCIHDGYNSDTQVRLGKSKDRLDKVIDNTPDPKPQKHKHGHYGRILLTDDQYNALVSEYGKDFIDEQIELLDEYVESNDNKNKYKDFNLVIRKSIRDKWFAKSRKQKPKTTQTVTVDEYKPTEDLNDLLARLDQKRKTAEHDRSSND